MNAFTNSLEKMGSNFLVAAMIPSLAFLIAIIFLFDPIFHIATAFRNPAGIYQLVGFSLFLFILTVIVGFTLTALNTYVLKIFEGYEILFPIRFLYSRSLRSHQQNAHRIRLHRDRLKSLIHDLQDAALEEQEFYPSHPDDTELQDLMDRYYQIVSEYQLSYPENPDDILPTKFGNTLRAAENYPGERYGFDGIHFWPRLVDVISSEYKLSIDNVRNELSFLVNMSILSFIFSILCVLAMLLILPTLHLASGGPTEFIEVLSKTWGYLLAAALGFVNCALFYRASIFSVGSFGLMIRSAFDLFRIDLLKRLQLERPNDSIEEFQTWQNINELIVLGSHSVSFKKIDYCKED